MDGRIYIQKMGEKLDRAPHTIRQWIRDEVLPASLEPQRDERGRLYWTASQVDPLKNWAQRRAERQGWPKGRRAA